MSKQRLKIVLEQPGGIKQTIILCPDLPEEIYCESIPIYAMGKAEPVDYVTPARPGGEHGPKPEHPEVRPVRRCRNCKRYEWSGDPTTYGYCKQWILQGNHLQVAREHEPVSARSLEPDPGFYCNAWEGEP